MIILVNLYFTYRWLLLECKREFPFNESLRVLEVMWATLPIDNELPQLSETLLLPLTPTNSINDILCTRCNRLSRRRALSCPQFSIIDEKCSRKNRQHSSSVTYRNNYDNLSSSMHHDFNSTFENDEYQLYSSIKYDKYGSSGLTKSKEKSFENSFSLSELSEFESDTLSTCPSNTLKANNTAAQVSSSTNWVSRLPTNDTIWLDDDNSFLLFLCISILLAHRTYLLKQKHIDEQEISMHFDRYRRRHNAERLLTYARTLYGQYIQWARKKRMVDDLNSFSAS